MKQLLILLALISCAVQAEIYKFQNEKGEWIYSDKRPPSAEPLKLPPLSTYTPQTQTLQFDPVTQKKTSDVYKSMVFVEPENDIVIRGNEGIVNVVVKLDPQLNSKRGHKIQYYLDQAPYGIPSVSSKTTLKNIDRGTHVLGAAVLDTGDKPVFRAVPVTFHVLRLSINSPNRIKPPPPPKAKKSK